MSVAWPNVEAALVAYLKTQCQVPVYTETLGSMPDRYLMVERVGGYAEDFTLSPEVEITVSSRISRGDMWALAAEVETAMVETSAALVGGVYVDACDTRFAFAFDPTTVAGVRQASATFILHLRPQ